MTTFMDVIGSQTCPGPFGGFLCESDSFSWRVNSQGITFIIWLLQELRLIQECNI